MSESNGMKRLLIVGSIIIGLLLVILLVAWILSQRKPRFVEYSKAIDLMQTAAAKYYEKNNDKLPVEDGDYVLSYETLVENELIVPLNELLADGDQCNAHIMVTNKSNTYTYTPYLNCKDGYQTTELYKVLTQEDKIVTSGAGLYKDETMGYYYRGDVTNNYIRLGTITKNDKEIDNLWRIISIEPDNTIRIKKVESTNSRYLWDDRYNVDFQNNFGYNKFELSKIKSTLDMLQNRDSVMSELYRNKIVPKKLCVNSRKEDDTAKDASIECATLSEKEYNFGVMYPYEFMRASLDENCKRTISMSCSNYNYLANDPDHEFEWSLNANPDISNEAFVFTGSTYEYYRTSSEQFLYLTTYLSDKVFFDKGTGTKEDPYLIR